MKTRRLAAVARKEFRHILRDPRSLLMALGMPFVQLLLFGYALTLDVDRIPTLIYDADRTPQSRELIERFRGSRFFEIHGFVADSGVIQKALDEEQALLGVVIPEDYSENLLSGREAEVQFLINGSDSNTAGISLGYIESLVATETLRLRAAEQDRRTGLEVPPPVEARLRVLYNSELRSRNYIVPGLIAVILMIIGSLLTSMTIAREWEMGTMEQVLSTPLRPSELALGKMLAYSAIGIADVVVTVVAAIFIFDIPFRGSVLLLAAGSGLFLIGALFTGILISAVTRSQLLAYQASMIASFLPAFLLSGFVFAIEAMPRPIQVFTHIVPARYFVVILKGVFLKGVGLGVLFWEFLFLLLYALLVFVVTVRKLRQKVA